MSVVAACAAAFACTAAAFMLCAGAARSTNTRFRVDALGACILAVSVVASAVLFSGGAAERAVLVTCLAASWVSDVQSGLVYDRVLGATAVAVLAIASYDGCARDALTGAATGFLAMYALRFWSRGRGLGLGDVKLAGVIGGALGDVRETSVALGAAFVIGGVVAGIGLATHRLRRDTPLPFAPFLSLGSAVAMLQASAVVGIR